MKNLIVLIISAVVFWAACSNSEDKKGETVPKEIQLAEKKCMDNVIEQDAALGETRNHASEKISLSATITDYVTELDAISFEHCPKYFTKTFKEHRDAWMAMKEVTDSYPQLRGEMHDLFDQIEAGNDSLRFRSHLKPIWDTWENVEKSIEEY